MDQYQLKLFKAKQSLKPDLPLGTLEKLTSIEVKDFELVGQEPIITSFQLSLYLLPSQIYRLQ